MLYNLKDKIYAICRVSHQNPMDIRNRSSFSHELCEMRLGDDEKWKS
ncbi:MAG: hypothetical protein BWX72_00388 [Firmicutes bacterium ADurb.Bin080]|nr:MAG: hypothetical protein BWX72_00388 [Firmicutes bacterium ADurb.Bin080]